MSRDAALNAAARILAAPLPADVIGPDVTTLVPGITPAEAQVLQGRIKALQCTGGDHVAGHVAAFTSPGSQRLMPDIPVPLVGAFLASHLLEEPAFERDGRPCLIEAEIGVLLATDLSGPEVDEAVARAAVAGWFAAIEIARVIPGSLTNACSAAQMIALQKSAGGGILCGPTIPDSAGFDPAAEEVVLLVDGVETARTTGAAAMDTGPLTVIAAMARRLAETGQGLKAGQILLTGSLAAPQLLQPAAHKITARFATLGSVELTVTG